MLRCAPPILATLVLGCQAQRAELRPTSAPELPPTPRLTLPAERWVQHLETTLMPFWMSQPARGKTHKDPFPTHRCKDGKAFGEPGCDLSSGEYQAMSEANATARRAGSDGPYEWLTGPNNELLSRDYVRMHSRQTYAYGVAYHLTGRPEYLALAHRGVTWLLEKAIDRAGGSYTFVERGRPGPAPDLRTSQDQAYALLGLAFYYYLTRDPQVLEVLTALKGQVKSQYLSPDWEGGRLVRWMRKTRREPRPTCVSTIPSADTGTVEQKDLVSILDQVNAYMLLTTISAPPEARGGWLSDLHSMAQTIRERFYNDGLKSHDQRHTGMSPAVPPGMFASCLTYAGPPTPPPGKPFCQDGRNPPPFDPENCSPSGADFGHSIKSFWMLYLVGREAGDEAMEAFAVDGADRLLPRAYLEDGSWARALRTAPGFDPRAPRFVASRDKEWWIAAELDQVAGTMALRDAPTHVPRLNTTYAHWLTDFSPDGLEVVHWLSADCQAGDPRCPGGIPKANIWKNGFHSTEHALVAYLTTKGVERSAAVLYFALVGEQSPALRPYYFRATATTKPLGTVEDEGTTYRVVRAEFSDIR